jgi:hypothetical protein
MKLLSRIVAPNLSKEDQQKGNIASTLHDHTYGITSDPLTQFACVFSALIHDVDHTGVPNTQLAKENPHLATMYKERSIAEQNSVDLAWNLLMGEGYENLREAICCNMEEQKRFRQLVVNSVMATDIMDKGFKELRNARWEKAFSVVDQSLSSSSSGQEEESVKDKTDRKATIVIEHLIQASDVSHTMQHWHVYRKWNECLFAEMYKAYIDGRAEKNPADFWVKGELGFFDFYIIPLAKKLKDCGVFGVSSDEYLMYALQNRKEWEARGSEVVAEMMERMQEAFHPKSLSSPILTESNGLLHDHPHHTPATTPASPVKRAICAVTMNRTMSIEDLMQVVEDKEEDPPTRDGLPPSSHHRRAGRRRLSNDETGVTPSPQLVPPHGNKNCRLSSSTSSLQ